MQNACTCIAKTRAAVSARMAVADDEAVRPEAAGFGGHLNE